MAQKSKEGQPEAEERTKRTSLGDTTGPINLSMDQIAAPTTSIAKYLCNQQESQPSPINLPRPSSVPSVSLLLVQQQPQVRRQLWHGKNEMKTYKVSAW